MMYLGAGTGGLTTNVDDIGSFVHHTLGLGYGSFDIVAYSIARERIGAEVNDTHDIGAFTPAKFGTATAG